jgi:hypothetical protein
MTDQTSVPETVTLKELNAYLKEKGLSTRTASRFTRAVVFHFQHSVLPDCAKPAARCSICSCDWWECPHFSIDSPVFDRENLTKVVEAYFPPKGMGIGELADRHIRGWLGLPERQS